MKKFSKMFRAFALVMAMVCVLCVNSFAACRTFTVRYSNNNIVTLKSDAGATYRYITVTNTGNKPITLNTRQQAAIYENGRIVWRWSTYLAANRSVTYRVSKTQQLTFYGTLHGGQTNLTFGGYWQYV